MIIAYPVIWEINYFRRYNRCNTIIFWILSRIFLHSEHFMKAFSHHGLFKVKHPHSCRGPPHIILYRRCNYFLRVSVYLGSCRVATRVRLDNEWRAKINDRLRSPSFELSIRLVLFFSKSINWSVDWFFRNANSDWIVSTYSSIDIELQTEQLQLRTS